MIYSTPILACGALVVWITIKLILWLRKGEIEHGLTRGMNDSGARFIRWTANIGIKKEPHA
jgi:hypothetical protein